MEINNEQGAFKLVEAVLSLAIKNIDTSQHHRELAETFAESKLLKVWCDVAELDYERVYKKLVPDMKQIEKFKLYNGDIHAEKHIYEKYHRYKINDNWVKGVTTYLGIIDKPALTYWAADMACEYIREVILSGGHITDTTLIEARNAHQNIKQEAADSGTLVHKWAEDFINGKNPPIPGEGKKKVKMTKQEIEVQNGVLAFSEWVNKHNVKFVSSERVVYSKEHNYIGTMDAEAIIDGKKCVIDFKTSSGIWDEYFLQVAAYQRAAEEEGSKYDGDPWIVRFSKKDKIDKKTGKVIEKAGTFEAESFDDIERYFQGFLAAKSLYKCLKEK